MCLSESAAQPQWVGGRATLLRRSPHMRLAAALLESYERQIQSVEGALRVRPARAPRYAQRPAPA